MRWRVDATTCPQISGSLARLQHECADLKDVVFVSISVDPEHDGPKQLLDYSRQQGADARGWYFLTGSPRDVDRALAGFKISREIGPDGSVGHVVNMMLIGPDGRLVNEYNGEVVKAESIVDDVRKTLNKG